MSIQNEESQVEVVQPETEVKEEAVETEKEEVQVENPEILALKTEVQECKEQVLRAQAELQNMRRRCEQDIEKAKKFAIDRFVDALLPVLDPLEKSVQYMDRENEQIKPLLDGVEQTLNLFIQALNKNGVEAIDPEVGKDLLDPNVHHAIQMIDNEELPTNTIINVVQKGYQLNGRVLRPALVVVSKGGASSVDAQA